MTLVTTEIIMIKEKEKKGKIFGTGEYTRSAAILNRLRTVFSIPAYGAGEQGVQMFSYPVFEKLRGRIYDEFSLMRLFICMLIITEGQYRYFSNDFHSISCQQIFAVMRTGGE